MDFFQTKNASKMSAFMKSSPPFSERDDVCVCFNWQELTVSLHAERSVAPVADVEVYKVSEPDFKQTAAFPTDVCPLAQAVRGSTFDAFDGTLHCSPTP